MPQAQPSPQIEGKDAAAAFKAFREKNGRPVKLATQPIGSGPNTALQHWLWEVVKADKADVQIVEMGIDATQRAIVTNAVEGGSVREPALAIIRKQNAAIKLVATGNDMFPNFPGVVVAVMGPFADKNPQAVDGLVRSVIRATALLKEHPEKAVKHVGAAFGNGLVPDDILLEALKSPQTQFTSDPRRIEDSTKAAVLPGQDRRAAKGGIARGPVRLRRLQPRCRQLAAACIRARIRR